MKARKVILYAEELQIVVTFKRIKKLRLTVRPPLAEVRVSAPIRSSLKAVEVFISAHMDWIERHRADILSRAPAPLLPYVSGRTKNRKKTLVND